MVRSNLLDLVDELGTRDLAGLQVVQAAEDTLETAAADLLGVSLDLAVGEQLLSQFPEHAAELEVLRLSGDGSATEAEGLTNNSVAQSALVLDVLAGRLGREKEGDDTTLAGKSVATDVGGAALGDAVECVLEVVLGVLADLLGALGVLVVEGGVGAERLDEVPVVRRADGDDLEAGELGVLDGEGTGGGRGAVDEDGEGLLSGLGGEGELQALVET